MKPGDEILGINGYAPTRKTFLKIAYFFDALHPQPALRMVLHDPAGNERTANIAAQIIEYHPGLGSFVVGRGLQEAIRDMDLSSLSRDRVVEMGDELMILKFPHFHFHELRIDSLIAKARKHKALILDLRGNGGGSGETLKYLLGGVFDRKSRLAILCAGTNASRLWRGRTAMPSPESCWCWWTAALFPPPNSSRVSCRSRNAASFSGTPVP